MFIVKAQRRPGGVKQARGSPAGKGCVQDKCKVVKHKCGNTSVEKKNVFSRTRLVRVSKTSSFIRKG